MSNCKTTRVNEQYHCSCGLQWDIDEADPHGHTGMTMNFEDVPLGAWDLNGNWYHNPLLMMTKDEQYAHNVKGGHIKPTVHRTIGNKALTAIKENLNRE